MFCKGNFVKATETKNDEGFKVIPKRFVGRLVLQKKFPPFAIMLM